MLGRGRGLGSPRGPPPCRGNPGRWALEEGLATRPGPSGAARYLCAPAVAGQKGSGARESSGPNRVQIRRSTPPSRSSCTLPQMEGG